MISFNQWPTFSLEEKRRVNEVLGSGKVNYWTGTECNDFENEFAQFHGRKYGISLANGTLALELALIAVGLEPSDEVIVPSRTYFATASCVVARGGKPVPADIDLISQNVTVETLDACVNSNTKGVIVVHLGGWPCDMKAIKDFCSSKGLFLIEDCAQAHGAKIDGQSVGSFGDCAAFSFCQDKIMSTGGEGGMLLIDDDLMWERAWSYKDHGKSLKKIKETADTSGFKWLHQSFGSNWRMTEIQAAIGRIQLGKLNDWVDERRKNAQYLYRGLSSVVGLNIPLPPEHVKHAYYRFYMFLEKEKLSEGWDQLRILERISSFGVPCFVGSCGEIYKEEAFGLFPDIHERQLEVSNYLSEISLAFLVHPGLPLDALDLTVETVKNVMLEATS